MKPFEINYRAVYALPNVASGYSGLEKVCGFLNLPKPKTQEHFDTISNVLDKSAKVTADLSMISAANVLRTGSRGYISVSVLVTATGISFIERDCRCNFHIMEKLLKSSFVNHVNKTKKCYLMKVLVFGI